MTDIIKLLPDSVANQIAAGEVVQRPASVVKELVENAIDAGATSITVILKDAGRTLIQVIDNGKGMSETDARLAFERHATSKITNADDLFAICTMGFRGEALASIAAIAEVTLRTKRNEDELGTEINIKASEFIGQEPISCNTGTNFAVKNLFYNVPARRKFLKTDNHELRMSINEIQRVALPFPNIEIILRHNETEIYRLTATNYRQRVVQMFSKNMNQNIVDLKTDTSIVKISGFIGKPEAAKKTYGEQFFFVNHRFMKHPFFHKAVVNAYSRILSDDAIPSYFIFLEVDPGRIDVNIHPTKTEIKFEDEQSIWQILHATVKEALGKYNVGPSLDFDVEAAIHIPVLNKDTQVRMPQIDLTPNYNPFDNEPKTPKNTRVVDDYFARSNLKHWDILLQGFENAPKEEEPVNAKLFDEKSSQPDNIPGLMQLKNKYILSPVKSGLMLIDQKRAHERILFEKYLETLSGKHAPAQKNLFPVVIELPADDYELIMSMLEQINFTGFDINSFGNHSIVVNGCPADLENPNPRELVEKILEELKTKPSENLNTSRDRLAYALSKASALNYGRQLTSVEMRDLIDRLFSCSNPNFSPDGKPAVSIMGLEELDKKFTR